MRGGRGKRKAVEKGVAIATGASAGWVTGGPFGALVGGSAPVVQWAAQEAVGRLLSAAEADRVAAALAAAAERIEERIEAGDEPRRDEFNPDERSPDAKRLAEGVLMTAQRDYEDRKAAMYGRMLANIMFERAIDPLTANALLRLAADLSYTQLGLIALVGEEPRRPLPTTGKSRGQAISWPAATVHADLADLGYGQREIVMDKPPERPGLLPTDLMIPANLELRSQALALFHLMELHRFERADLDHFADALWEWSGEDPAGPASTDQVDG